MAERRDAGRRINKSLDWTTSVKTSISDLFFFYFCFFFSLVFICFNDDLLSRLRLQRCVLARLLIDARHRDIKLFVIQTSVRLRRYSAPGFVFFFPPAPAAVRQLRRHVIDSRRPSPCRDQ